MDEIALLGPLADDIEIDELLRIDDVRATSTGSSCYKIVQRLDCTIGEVFSVYVQVIFAYWLTFPCGFPWNIYLMEHSRFRKQELACSFLFSFRRNFLMSVSHTVLVCLAPRPNNSLVGNWRLGLNVFKRSMQMNSVLLLHNSATLEDVQHLELTFPVYSLELQPIYKNGSQSVTSLWHSCALS